VDLIVVLDIDLYLLIFYIQMFLGSSCDICLELILILMLRTVVNISR